MAYVTKKDYFDFAGIDLSLELKGTATDNPTKVVNIFLTRVENWCLDYLQMQHMVLPTSENFNEAQFKKGVLHQIDYIRKNGDVSLQAISSIAKLAPNAYMAFKNGGMCNSAHHREVAENQWV